MTYRVLYDKLGTMFTELYLIFNLLHIYYHVRRNKIGLQDKTNHEKEIGVTH